jgi:exopolysaccharide biosynthesis protein
MFGITVSMSESQWITVIFQRLECSFCEITVDHREATRFGLLVRDLNSMHEVLGSILIVNQKKRWIVVTLAYPM